MAGVHQWSLCLRSVSLRSDPHPVVVGGVWVLVAGDDLGGHPVRRPDEGVPSPNSPIQLSADAKVHCEAHRLVLLAVATMREWGRTLAAQVKPRTQFDFGVFRQQHVLSLDVTMDDVVSVQVSQTLQTHGQQT